MYNYSKLRGLIREKYGTLKAFSDKLGIGLTTLNSRLKGDSYFNQQEIEKTIELLELSETDIYVIFFTK